MLSFLYTTCLLVLCCASSHRGAWPLANHMDCSQPGTSVHVDSLGKNTGVGSMPSSRSSPYPGIKARSPELQVEFLPTEPRRKSILISRHYLFIYFLITDIIFFLMWLHWVLVVAHGIFYLHSGMQILSWGMWNLVPWPRIEPWSPARAEWSLSHWTTKEVPQ